MIIGTRMTRRVATWMSLLLLSGATPSPETKDGWQPEPQLLADLDRRKVTWNHDERRVPQYRLPDPLACPDGSRATSTADWERKCRPTTLDLFRQHVYGRSPDKPAEIRIEVLSTDQRALDGQATLKRIRIISTDGGKSFAFEAAIMLPNAPKGPMPAFLLINNRSVASADPTRKVKDEFWPAERIIARGYAAAVFQTNDVDPDKPDEAARARGVRGVFAGPGKPGEDAWATLSAWAWGASRVADYLQSDDRIDPARLAVVGHSRGGKTALWAAAQDRRFAIAISNDSGCGGAALSRRRYGETVAAINRSFPYWFCGSFKKFNGREDELPIDQHQLISLIAPRGVYVASADADFWADQRGEFLSLAHASAVYGLYGNPAIEPGEMPPLETALVRGQMAYHIRKGGHGLTLYDWERFMDFADRLGWMADSGAAK